MEYQYIIEKYKNKKEITKKENELTLINLKTCDYELFKRNIGKKNKINKKIIKEYDEEIFKKYKWYSYINEQKSDTKIVNKIKETFGNNIVIIMGDWSIGKQMRNYISTPNIGLKRMLSKYYKIYDVDEYRSSCICYKNKTRCDNLKIKDKEGNNKKMHQILTYKMENERIGCINRDKNGVNGIKEITEGIIKEGKRPEIYSRNRKKEIKEIIEEIMIEIKKEMIIIKEKFIEYIKKK